MSEYSYSSHSTEGMSSVHSTPLKADSRTAASKVSATQARSNLPLPKRNDKFVQCHLPSVALPDTLDRVSRLQPHISAIQSASSETDMYQPVTKLLNLLSQTAYDLLYPDSHSGSIADNLAATSLRPSPALIFSPSPTQGPKGDVFNVRVKPDILAYFSTAETLHRALDSSSIKVREPSKTQDTSSKAVPASFTPPPWSHVESAVEAKRDNGKATRQVNHYTDSLLRYRPDKTKVLCLTFNQTGYIIFSADACGVDCSPDYAWGADIATLFQYVYSLYLPGTSDPTFSSVDDGNHLGRWHISFDGKSYDMRPFLCRTGAGRRTWLAVGRELGLSNSGALHVVKDLWRDDQRRFEEGALIAKIHRDGFVPGVVRQVASGPVNGLVVGTPPSTRAKHRLVMGSTGSRLSACASVLQFLKVMYDVLEAHQHVAEKGVLHRDVSWFNILCSPCHHVDGKELDRPCIAKLMNEEKPQPCCLLTDFDNASEIDESSIYQLTQRTGTPMFIAIDISSGRNGHEAVIPRNITSAQFQLDGEAYDRYVQTYGKHGYDAFDTFLASVIAEDFPEQDPFENTESSDTVVHQPFHDVESIFWTIVWFLMRACPTNHDQKLNAAFIRTGLAMLNHQIDNDDCEGRTLLLCKPQRGWEEILHPECQGLAKMLTDMSAYLSTRWLRFPTAPPYHAHEALKRLLLKEIVQMTREDKSIPLQDSPRSLQNPKSSISSFTASSASRDIRSSTQSAPSLAASDTRSSSGGRKRQRSRSPGPSLHQPKRKKSQATPELFSGDGDLVVKQWLQRYHRDGLWF